MIKSHLSRRKAESRQFLVSDLRASLLSRQKRPLSLERHLTDSQTYKTHAPVPCGVTNFVEPDCRAREAPCIL